MNTKLQTIRFKEKDLSVMTLKSNIMLHVAYQPLKKVNTQNLKRPHFSITSNMPLFQNLNHIVEGFIFCL